MLTEYLVAPETVLKEQDSGGPGCYMMMGCFYVSAIALAGAVRMAGSRRPGDVV